MTQRLELQQELSWAIFDQSDFLCRQESPRHLKKNLPRHTGATRTCVTHLRYAMFQADNIIS